MQKKVLITGGSHAELPMIDALHRLGYYVISTGTNDDGLGHKEADEFIHGDFSDKEFITRIAKENGVSGIVSGCNDFAYISTAYACEKLQLGGHDSYETATIVHHKNRFRKVLKDSGCRYPAFRTFSKKEELLACKDSFMLPLVVKPTDLTGGKGVMICQTWDEVVAAFDKALALSRQSQILVEEFITGTNHGVSALLKDQKVCFAFFDNEEYFLNKYLVSGAYSPSSLSDAVKNDIISQINAIADTLSLHDGLFHCQCIITDDDIPYLIDPCRRAPGDLYIRLVALSTGVDYPMEIVRAELGLSLSDDLSIPKDQRNIARECIMAEKEGIIKAITLDPAYAKHEIDRLQWGFPGDVIEDHMTYKAGIVFFEYPTAKELSESMQHLYEHMKVEV